MPSTVTTDRPGGVVVLGSGFVGSAIARQIATPSGDQEQQQQQQQQRKVTMLSRSTHPDLTHPGPAAQALIRSEIDRIGATAVVNSVGRQHGTSQQLAEANVDWPGWLAGEVLPGTGCRLVHLGSASEYGDQGSAEPIPETAEAHPQGAYGETKWAGSQLVLQARRNGLDAVVARGFNLVGPHLPAGSPLHQFLTDLAALGPDGGGIEVWWPPTVRDFVLLDDLAAAVAALTTAATVPDVVNVCSGVGLSFAEVVAALAHQHHKPVEIVSLERPGIPAVIGDPQRLQAVCGFRPAMTAELLAAHAGIGDRL